MNERILSERGMHDGDVRMAMICKELAKNSESSLLGP